jgi:hypothetical protein
MHLAKIGINELREPARVARAESKFNRVAKPGIKVTG